MEPGIAAAVRQCVAATVGGGGSDDGVALTPVTGYGTTHAVARVGDRAWFVKLVPMCGGGEEGALALRAAVEAHCGPQLTPGSVATTTLPGHPYRAVISPALLPPGHDETASFARCVATSDVPLPLLHQWGELAGQLCHRLRSFEPPAGWTSPPPHTQPWDMRHALQHRAGLASLSGDDIRAAAAAALDDFEREVVPLYVAAEEAGAAHGISYPGLRRQWVHGDLNEYNVLWSDGAARAAVLGAGGVGGGSDVYAGHVAPHLAVRAVDWEDMSHSYGVHEAAVAVTYAMLDRRDPLTASTALLYAFGRRSPLNAREVGCLLALVRTRLAVSLCMSAGVPSDHARAAYVHVHTAAASRALLWLHAIVHGGGDGASWAPLPSPAGYTADAFTQAWAQAQGHAVPPRPIVGYTYGLTLTPRQVVQSQAVVAWLRARGDADAAAFHPVVTPPPTIMVADGSGDGGGIPRVWEGATPWPSRSPPYIYDFTGSSGKVYVPEADTPASAADSELRRVTDVAFHHLMTEEGVWARVGWGRYGENRTLYQSDHFKPGALQPRTMHLGVDLEGPAGTPVHAPLSGVIHSLARNLAELDYGPTIILRHTLPATASGDGEAAVFYTLYGHLSLDSVLHPATGQWRWKPGQVVEAGEVVGWIGDGEVNGGWPPHVHFQINTEVDHGGRHGDYPGVAALADWPVYRTLCPDPNLILRCPWLPLCHGDD